jgi:hypothetical protein
VFVTEDGKKWVVLGHGIYSLDEITISALPPELAAMREAEEVEVDHWHATLVTPDADGVWDYELMESPALADDWRTYDDFWPSEFSMN